jgi:tetratricopeptide (TPR) repeat protein
MKPSGSILMVCLWLWVLSAQADTLTLKNQQVQTGTIKKFENAKVTFEITLSGGSAQVTYDLSQIVKFDLSRTPQENALLTSTNLTDLPALQAFWERRRAYLAFPESDTGEVGQRLVQLLLQKNDATTAKSALELCAVLEKDDWNVARREAVKSLRLQALIQTGQTDAAIAEAEKVTDLTPENATAIVEAKFVLAQAALGKLRELETKNPRWTEIRALRTQRAALLQQALDEFLFPVVFYPENQKLTARALWNAADLAARNDQTAPAALWAKEIVQEFPDPDYLARAKDLTQKLETKTKTAKE